MAIKRVLVVDDEQPVRDVLTQFLKYLGYDSETAGNAAEALNKIQAAQFDLVLTDYNMPGMKGDELGQAIKRQKPELRVVLITGREPPNLSSAIDRVLHKPFSMVELREMINSLT